jgi:ketosteroid isomerase-like protein
MRKSEWLFLVGAAAVGGCQRSPAPMSDAQRQAVAQDVRGLADSLVVQLSRLDAQPYLAQLASNEGYAENGAFYPTRDSLLSAVGHFTKMFTSLELAWDGEPRITVLSPDAAVLSGTFHEVAQPVSGSAMKVHGIWTGVYQRINGEWRIVQAHESWTPDQPTPKK